MIFLVDTHALFWLLSGDKKLSGKAKLTIEQADRIYVPTIVLLELLYLFEKKKTTKTFTKVLESIKRTSHYTIISQDVTVVEETSKLSMELEMHDRIIVATAKILSVPLITKDKVIKKLYKNTIW